MKEVVVVVSEDNRVVITGKNLDVIDGISNAGLDGGHPVKLVIRDEKKTIAVFKDWMYWKEVTHTYYDELTYIKAGLEAMLENLERFMKTV